MRKIKVYCGFPTIGTISDAQVFQMRRIEKEYGDRIEFVYPELIIHRIFHDFARNEIVEEFLKTDCDVLWFLDSDICPSRNLMNLVTDYYDKWELAGGIYPVFMGQAKESERQIVYTVYKTDGIGMYPSKVPYSGMDYVDGLGTGCMLIKRGVFARLQKPYFEFKYESESRRMVEGEDLGFCKKINALGYKFLTDYSMVCKHYKTVDLVELNNYAIDYANKSVVAYDNSIKEQIKEAVRAAFIQGQRSAAAPKSSLILPGR